MKKTIHNYLVNHYIKRSNWLRAADYGVISISSLAIGVTAASTPRDTIVSATGAGFRAELTGLQCNGRIDLLALCIDGSPARHTQQRFCLFCYLTETPAGCTPTSAPGIARK